MSANMQQLVAGSPLNIADGKYQLDKVSDLFVLRRDQLAPMAVKHTIQLLVGHRLADQVHHLVLPNQEDVGCS